MQIISADASKDIAAYEAAQCNRSGVSVMAYFHRLIDLTAWVFSEEKHSMGLDPWTEVQGVDCNLDSSVFYVDVSATKSLQVTPGFRVFVQNRDLATSPENRD